MLKCYRLILAACAIAIGGVFYRSFASVTINEVVYRDFGDDDSTFVELHGPAGTNLALGWQLVGVNGSNGQIYATIDLNGVIPVGGFYVIGQSPNVPNVDQVDGLVNFQNESDNIQLRHNGQVVDAIGYGTFAPPNTFFEGEGSPCPAQPEGYSLCRFPDGNDTGDNAVDFHLTQMLTPGESNILIPFFTLSELRANSAILIGQIVRTAGIANVNSTLFNGPLNINAYMQDDSGGINLFGGNWTFAQGDCLRVQGTINQYANLLELTAITQLTVGPNIATPIPIPITCQIANQNGESLESMLVHLENIWITDNSPAWPDLGSDANLLITDNSSDTLALRIDSDTGLNGWMGHPQPGQMFNVTAILSQFGSIRQALPRYQSDFGALGALRRSRPVGPTEYRLDSPRPNPFNLTTIIHFSLARPGKVTLEAFALNGSRVAVIMDGHFAVGSYEIAWNANHLPSGLYLLRLISAEGQRTVKAVLVK